MTVANESSIKIKSIHHTAFRCRDAEQTRWFYEDVIGLKAAAGLVLDVVPGSGDQNPYMHIFFELGDGNYIAFFDAPGNADPAWFARKDSFDMHIAVQVDTEEDLLAMQARVRSFGINCGGPLDHGIVRSVYMYDPNGIQFEITTRARDHDRIMAEEKQALQSTLSAWTERTRQEKLAKFGTESLMLRGSAPRKR
jgi:catechol 2,3-dioxygenase-like lactoylglutathione lyase family enzyme